MNEEEERSEVSRCHQWTDAQSLLQGEIQDSLGCAMDRQGKSLDAIEGRMQFANKAFLEGHVGLQGSRCAVENRVLKIGGPCVFRLLVEV